MFVTSAFARATLTTLNTSWQSGQLASSHIASVKWVAWTKTAIVIIIIVNINKHLQHHHSTTNCIIFNGMPDRLRGGDAGRSLLGRRQCVQEGRAGCLWRRCGVDRQRNHVRIAWWRCSPPLPLAWKGVCEGKGAELL